MGLTLRTVDRDRVGQKYENIFSVTFTGTYPTGGEPITAKQMGLASRIFRVDPHGDTGGYLFAYDYTNKKLKAYRDNGTASAAPLPEVANGTALTGVTGLRITVTGV